MKTRGTYSLLLAISGYAAFTILELEAGLHVLEEPGVGKQFERYKVRVAVVAQPEEPLGDDRETCLLNALEILSQSSVQPSRIVRRYRERPSPLVRDVTRQWRTGKLSAVLEGNFDLFSMQ